MQYEPPHAGEMGPEQADPHLAHDAEDRSVRIGDLRNLDERLARLEQKIEAQEPHPTASTSPRRTRVDKWAPDKRQLVEVSNEIYQDYLQAPRDRHQGRSPLLHYYHEKIKERLPGAPSDKTIRDRLHEYGLVLTELPWHLPLAAGLVGLTWGSVDLMMDGKLDGVVNLALRCAAA